MPAEPHTPPVRNTLDVILSVPFLCGVTVLALSLLSLLGWWFDLSELTSFLPKLATMKGNTTAGLILAALALGGLPLRQRTSIFDLLVFLDRDQHDPVFCLAVRGHFVCATGATSTQPSAVRRQRFSKAPLPTSPPTSPHTRALPVRLAS